MEEERVFLGLGSNLGDREKMLRLAVVELERARGVRVDGCSSIYETAPVGVKEQPWFLNMVVEARVGLEPQDLLLLTQDIENRLGRRRIGRWGARTIDLDILLFGDRQLAEDNLVIPHSAMMERLFVLVPLAEIAADLKLPGGISVQAMIHELEKQNSQKVLLWRDINGKM